MSEIVDQSLKKIVKGTGLVFFGTVISMPLSFVVRLIIVRNTTQAEYGMYSLAMALLNIVILASMLGLHEGAARCIAYYRGKKEEKKVRSIIIFSAKTTLIVSIVSFLILFVFSDGISEHIFHIPEFSTPLKLFAVGVPLIVLANTIVSFFRGFDRVKPKIYFLDISRSSIYVVCLGVSIVLHAGFFGIIYAYLASLVMMVSALFVYTIKMLPLPPVKSVPIGKELLLFSLPLLFAAVLNVIMHWTDTLMLAYFKPADIVGIYSTALPLSRLIPIALTSSTVIYVPIAAGLYAQSLLQEMKRTYQILTKWIFSFTIPVFFIFFLFSETVLHFLFGANYVQAAFALKLLSFGAMFHTVLGLNGLTLTVMGRTKYIMVVNLCGVIANVVLNVVLIPDYGITGAAFASLSSYCVVNILNSAKLYHISKIHPFTRNYVKPVGVSVALLGLMYVVGNQVQVSVVMLPLFLLFFVGAYGGLLLVTRSFDEEDIQMLLAIEKKVGVDLGFIKNILKKFV